MNTKHSLRVKYKKLREELSEDEIAEMSMTLANRSLELPIWDKTYYHLFLSITGKKEVDTEYLLHILHGKDKSIVISKSHMDTGEMSHFLLQENTILKVSKYGIPEPESGIEIDPKLVDVVFVPLLAFDTNGHRVGYGKGFYDRFLEKCRPDAIFIGLSFFGPEDSFETDVTDIPLHYCITPKKVHIFK